MSTNEALKPKIGLSKKDEKRKAKKEKLNQELAAKEEAKEEARRQEEEEKRAQIEEEVQGTRGPATMGNKFAELINQISMQNSEKKQTDPRRSNKKKASDAIKNAKMLLKSDVFQSNPVDAMSTVTAQLQQQIETEE